MEENRKSAVYVGSFDPITWGHLAIIIDILTVYDEVIIAVGSNPEKEKSLFSCQYRIELIGIALEELVDSFDYRYLIGREYSQAEILAIKRLRKNPDIVKVMGFDGMTVDFAIRNHVDTIIRGERIVGDHDVETKLSMMNKMLCDVRRVHLNKHQITVPQEKLTYISSSSAKEFALMHEYAAAANFVTPRVLDLLTAKYLRQDFRKLCESFGIDEMDRIDDLWFDLRRVYLPRRSYPLSFVGYCLNYLNIYCRNYQKVENYQLIKAALYYAYYNAENSNDAVNECQKASRGLSRCLKRKEQEKIENLIAALRLPDTNKLPDADDDLLHDVTTVIYGDKNNFGTFAFQLLLGKCNLSSEYDYARQRVEYLNALLSEKDLYRLDYFRDNFTDDAKWNLRQEQAYWQSVLE